MDSATADPTRHLPHLEPNEEGIRILAETTSTAIFIYREDRFLYVNPALSTLTGYSAEELLEMRPLEVTHPDHRELVAQRMQDRLAGRPVPNRYEVKILRKDGSVGWIDFSAGLIQFQGARAALGTASDITRLKETEIALRESEERLLLAQRAARIVTWDWNLATDELVISDHAAEIFGPGTNEAIRTGETFFHRVHPEDQERMRETVRRTLKAGGDFAIEVRIVTLQDEIRWLAQRGQAIQDSKGWTVRLIGVAHDITERKLAEEELFREKERAQVTIASIGDGVIRTDAQGRIDYLNPVAEKLTGWSSAEAAGRPLAEVFQVIDLVTGKPLLNPVERCLRERRSILLPGHRLLVRRDGTQMAIQDSAAPVRDRQGEILGAVLVVKDLGPLRTLERERDFLARFDPVTGLPNRQEFERHLEMALAGARKDETTHALCYLDLDQFKVINDTWGHQAGDDLLKHLAKVLGRCCRECDIVARLGGDEFGFLLRDCTLSRARELAERIRRMVKDFRFQWQGKNFDISGSIGLVPVSAASRDLAQLLSAADAACYAAKEAGRNRIHEYQPDDHVLAARYGEMNWLHRIHAALEEGRFQLYCQPIWALYKTAERGLLYEILLRMVDRDGRLVEPRDFIRAAERYQLIVAIDRWVVRSAFDVLAEQRRRIRDLPLRFAINLSGQSLSEEAFLEYVIARLEESGLAPSQIYFEITETAAVANLEGAIRFISVLKGIGCRFVLDDFGSGLSSFSYLKTLPVDFLKIDSEFVLHMAEDPVHRAVVESIQQVGQALGMETIAEGVEDRATLDLLRQMGVGYAQGYVFSRPQLLTQKLATLLENDVNPGSHSGSTHKTQQRRNHVRRQSD